MLDVKPAPRPLAVAFIAGPPKCGTTWMRHTLDSHPQAVVSGESNVAPNLLWPLIGQFDQYFQRSKGFLGQDDMRQTFRTIVDRVLAGYVARDRADGGRPEALRLVGDKSPGHTRHVQLLNWVYPEAKFVICVRDVRDAAVSAYMHFVRRSEPGRNFFGVGDDLARVAEIYARNHWAEMLRFARAEGARIGPSRYVEIEYAEHKTDPVGTVTRLLEFLDLDASADTVDALVDANSFERTSGGRRPGEEANAPARKGIVGDWRNHFSAEFGEHLVRVANERLALGEKIVTNTLDVTWNGPALSAPTRLRLRV